MSRSVVALVAAAALAACENDTVAPSEIIGDTWRLESLQEAGAAPINVDNPSRYTLEYSNEGRLLVRSDCNSCGGSYSLTGSSLEVGPLACTRAFCGDASLDGRYTSVLQRAQLVSLNGGAMIIQGSAGTLRLRAGP